MRLQPGTATHLIGRQTELDVIQQHIDAAVTGLGSLLLISGEAGVGKSRLVTELVERFQSRSPSSHVVTGNCFEGDHRLAYAPVLDLLRSYLTSRPHDDLQQLFRHDPDSFITLLPEHQRRFPDIAPLSGINPQQDKHRIFQALLALLAELAGDQPLLIIFEDLHWSDDTSLEFLTHLARSASSLPLLVVGTFRSEEEHPGLRRALVEISRGRHTVELRLGQLTLDEVDRFLRDIFDQPYSIRPDFLGTIFDLTEGNPLFIEETMKSMIAAGDIYLTNGRWSRKQLEQIRIPRSVQDAVARRSERLASETMLVLEHAAVIGQRFEFNLLELVTGLAADKLLGAIKEMVEARLIREETAERFRFHHALIRESIYDRMLVWERRQVHSIVADALETLVEDVPGTELAALSYHFHAAKRWDKAIQYCTEAGELAQSLLAPTAAVEHFSRALESYERLGKQPPATLFRQRGRAYEVLGQFEAARREFDFALSIARTSEDRREEWATLIDVGRSWEGLDYHRAGHWFEQALDIARSLSDPVILAHTLNRIGTWYCNTERVREARSAHLDALKLFEQLGDEAGIAATLDYLGTVADITGDLVEMRSCLERAAAMFERLGDRWRLASTLGTMACMRGIVVFDLVANPTNTTAEESIQWGTRALELSREVGWRSGEAYAMLNLCFAHIAAAEFTAAFQLMDAGLEIANEIQHHEWLAAGHLVIATAYHDILAMERALEHYETAISLAKASGSGWFQNLSISRTAIALLELGRVQAANDMLSSVLNDQPMDSMGQRWLWATRARIDIALGRHSEALDIIEQLAARDIRATSPQDTPLLALLRGMALAGLQRFDMAFDALLIAREGAIARHEPSKHWRIGLELARLHRVCDRDVDMRHAIDEVREVVNLIAQEIPNPALRGNFLSETAALIDALTGHPAISTLDQGSGLLTPREREVAQLVARGLSNRQIAEELFIGERTVETHVGNILRKLDLSSRTQLAALVLAESGSSAPL